MAFALEAEFSLPEVPSFTYVIVVSGNHVSSRSSVRDHSRLMVTFRDVCFSTTQSLGFTPPRCHR